MASEKKGSAKEKKAGTSGKSKAKRRKPIRQNR